jgi:hypothetical protein
MAMLLLYFNDAGMMFSPPMSRHCEPVALYGVDQSVGAATPGRAASGRKIHKK